MSRKERTMEELEGWALSYIDMSKANKIMRENFRKQVCNKLTEDGCSYCWLDETSTRASTILHGFHSHFHFELNLANLVMMGYEGFLIQENAAKTRYHLYILDTNIIEKDSPYAERDYEILTRQKIADFYQLFLMDAWEPEKLENFEVTIVIADDVLYERFLDCMKHAKLNTEISIIKNNYL